LLRGSEAFTWWTSFLSFAGILFMEDSAPLMFVFLALKLFVCRPWARLFF
jgi:hypothetical protein